jgi:hypothetical protein
VRILVAALAVAVAAAFAAGAIAGPPAHGPWLLAAVPSVGAVRWECTAGVPGLRQRHRLSFTDERDGATTNVALAVDGHAVARKRADPDDTVELPWTRADTMTLTLVQSTEPRTLVATVEVDFRPSPRISGGCEPYLPPAVRTTVRYR